MASGKLIRLFLRERKRKSLAREEEEEEEEEKAEVDKGVESNREMQIREK